MKTWIALAACLALSVLSGCGAELERSSEVETLRVLGVHKSAPYAAAGDEVTFSMLWHDAEGREVEPVWFAIREDVLAAFVLGQLEPSEVPENFPWDPESQTLLPICANPPRDSYFGCLQIHQALLSQEGFLELLSVPADGVALTVPRSLVEVELQGQSVGIPSPKACGEIDAGLSCSEMYHPAPDAENLPDFGSVFAFFALCAGELDFDPDITEGFGLICLDEDGEPLGSSDFVVGYSQVFLYEEFENQNPVVEGMRVAGEEATACVGLACLRGEDDERPEECGEGVPCLEVCTAEDEDDCPEIDIKPIIPERYASSEDVGDCEPESGGAGYLCNNAELDEIARLAYDRELREPMWVRYYTERGRMGSEVKLLNDAEIGWNSDYGTELRLPQEPGPLRIWAVAYDNRGGQNWVRVDAVVE